MTVSDAVRFEVGKLYMLSPNGIRDCYWLYHSHGEARIFRGEPFLVIELAVSPSNWHDEPATLVCNARGEVGMIDLTDTRNDPRPGFVPYVSKQQPQAGNA